MLGFFLHRGIQTFMQTCKYARLLFCELLSVFCGDHKDQQRYAAATGLRRFCNFFQQLQKAHTTRARQQDISWLSKQLGFSKCRHHDAGEFLDKMVNHLLDGLSNCCKGNNEFFQCLR
jgi:hypothetical protein